MNQKTLLLRQTADTEGGTLLRQSLRWSFGSRRRLRRAEPSFAKATEGACLPQAGRWSWREEVTRPDRNVGTREVLLRHSTANSKNKPSVCTFFISSFQNRASLFCQSEIAKTACAVFAIRCGAGGRVLPHPAVGGIRWFLKLSPANRKQTLYFVWFFLFLRQPYENKFLLVCSKIKNPGESPGLVSFVELEGVEPSSRQGDHMFSTCLVLLGCREKSGAERPNDSVVLKGSLSGQDLLPANSELRAPLNRVGTE